MATYALLLDKSAQDSQALQAFLANWKQSQKLNCKDYLVENVDQITTICREDGKKFTTIVAVGDEITFEAMLSNAKYFDEKVVLGYIPTSVNTLTKRLGIKDYKEGCDIVSQRKIVELTALSVGQQYFLFDFKINTANSPDQEASNNVHIHLDKAMQIDIPTNAIILHNRNQEHLPHNSPLLLEAYTTQKLSSDRHNVLKLAKQRLKSIGADEARLQLRIPANNLQIESTNELVDSYNHKLKTPLSVGLHKKPIRLIVKKGQELQAILSPGLIS